MINQRSCICCVLAVVTLLTSVVSASSADDEETRRLAATLYARCLDNEGAKLLAATPITRPSQFEKIAGARCKAHEDRFRQILQIDVLLPQVQQNKYLNKEAQAVLFETLEQAITSVRRDIVVIYAEEFDKRHPGLRSCSLAPKQLIDEKLKYLCAVRD